MRYMKWTATLKYPPKTDDGVVRLTRKAIRQGWHHELAAHASTQEAIGQANARMVFEEGLANLRQMYGEGPGI